MMHDGSADRPGEAIPSNAPDAVNYFPNQNPCDKKKLNIDETFGELFYIFKLKIIDRLMTEF
jgi:hypothetical protein